MVKSRRLAASRGVMFGSNVGLKIAMPESELAVAAGNAEVVLVAARFSGDSFTTPKLLPTRSTRPCRARIPASWS